MIRLMGQMTSPRRGVPCGAGHRFPGHRVGGAHEGTLSTERSGRRPEYAGYSRLGALGYSRVLTLRLATQSSYEALSRTDGSDGVVSGAPLATPPAIANCRRLMLAACIYIYSLYVRACACVRVRACVRRACVHLCDGCLRARARVLVPAWGFFRFPSEALLPTLSLEVCRHATTR